MANKKELTMEDIQKVSLNILISITDICKKLDLKYSLTWGTLLGAIRHRGFIPWDDDIDIMMSRPDYNILKNYFKTHSSELYPFKWFDEDVAGYPYMIARVCDDNYIIETDNEQSCGMGVFIDIYVLDGTANSYDEAWKFASRTCKYPRLIFLSTRNHYHFGTTNGFFKRLLKLFVYCYAKIRGCNYFKQKLMSLVDIKSYDNKDYVGNVIWCERPKYAVIKKTDYEDLIDVEFEKNHFKCIRLYDKYLRMWYGDYMQLPPEKDRIYHHLYKAYKK